MITARDTCRHLIDLQSCARERDWNEIGHSSRLIAPVFSVATTEHPIFARAPASDLVIKYCARHEVTGSNIDR